MAWAVVVNITECRWMPHPAPLPESVLSERTQVEQDTWFVNTS